MGAAKRTASSPGRPRRYLILLLFGLPLLVGALGCATVTMTTEVFRNDDGGHRGAFTVEIEPDPDVMVAVGNGASLANVSDEDLHAGWTMTLSDDQRSLTWRREVASLEELQAIPTELENLTPEMNLDFMPSLAVTVDEQLSPTLYYSYTAQVVVPALEEDTQTAPSGELDPWQQAVNEAMAMDPELEAAIKAAGPPVFVVELRLPGEIELAEVNGQRAGEYDGADRVRWTFDATQPSTYTLAASSLQSARIDPAEELLGNYLSGDASLREAEELANISKDSAEIATELAYEAAATLAGSLPSTLAAAERDEILVAVTKAFYLAELIDDTGKPQMLAVRAALPIVSKLALKAGTEEEARVALGRLVNLLMDYDMDRLRSQ